jgi:hypothetical protein
MHPIIGLLRALDVHGNYKIVLRSQNYQPVVCEFDPRAIQDWLGQSLDDNINLMWRAPDAQHLVRSRSNHAHANP